MSAAPERVRSAGLLALVLTLVAVPALPAPVLADAPAGSVGDGGRPAAASAGERADQLSNGSNGKGDENGTDVFEGNNSVIVESGETATPTATPERSADRRTLRVVEATLLTPQVRPGEYALVQATVENRGPNATTRVLALRANGTVLTSQSVTLPGGERRTVALAARVEATATLAVNDTDAGTVRVREPGGSNTATPGTATGSSNTARPDDPNGTATDGSNPAATAASDGGAGTEAAPEATATTRAAPAGTPAPTAAPTPDGGTPTTAETPAPEPQESGLPFPLSLWPDGLVGTALGAVVGLVVVVYGVLKALAIYLGY